MCNRSITTASATNPTQSHGGTLSMCHCKLFTILWLVLFCCCGSGSKPRHRCGARRVWHSPGHPRQTHHWMDSQSKASMLLNFDHWHHDPTSSVQNLAYWTRECSSWNNRLSSHFPCSVCQSLHGRGICLIEAWTLKRNEILSILPNPPSFCKVSKVDAEIKILCRCMRQVCTQPQSAQDRCYLEPPAFSRGSKQLPIGVHTRYCRVSVHTPSAPALFTRYKMITSTTSNL